MAKKPARPEDDTSEFQEIVTRASDLRSTFGDRDALFDEVTDVFWLDWLDEKPQSQSKDVRLTLSPDPADKIMGAWRLMTAAEPIVNIRRERNAPETEPLSDELKRFAKIMWLASGRLARKPPEKDLTLSALLYSQIHMGVTCLDDMLKMAQGDERRKLRVKQAQRRTPFLFEPYWARNCYPEFDQLGLIGHLREYETTFGALEEEYGEDRLAEVYGSYKRGTRVKAAEWWDLLKHCVWLAGVGTGTNTAASSTSTPLQASRPLYMADHGLGWIPIVVQSIEGSEMFGRTDYAARPWLYNLLRSGMWKRANLSLTVLFTVLFAVAQNALYKHKRPTGNTDKLVEVHFDRIGAGVIEMEGDETFDAMFQKGAIDPAIVQAVELTERKMTQSTIHAQALGEPLGANAPFSMVALLHQAGRLPLVPTQQMTGWAIAQAMEMAFRWMKQENVEAKASYGPVTVKLDRAKIPDERLIDVNLEIQLTQDKLSMLTAALQALASRLVGKEWIREELLHVGQSEEMDETIWNEQAAEAFVASMIQSVLAPKAPPEVGASTTPTETVPPGGEPTAEGEPPLPEGFHKMPDGTIMPNSAMPGQGTAQPGQPLSRPLPARPVPRGNGKPLPRGKP